MIVPMKKVSLMVMGDKKRETLKKLRKAGIVHIEITEGSGKTTEKLQEQISVLECAAFILSDMKNKNIEQKAVSVSEAVEIAREINSLDVEKKNQSNRRLALTAELDRLKNWGEINPDDINELSEYGVDISLYEMPTSEYNSLPETIKTVSLDKSKHSVKFAMIKSGNEDAEFLNGI